MLYRPNQSVRLRWLNPPVDSTRPFWRTGEYDLGHSSIPRWMACEHACDSATGCARGGSWWNKAFYKAGVRSCAPPVQHLLRGGYKRGLHAFQSGQRHHGRFRTPGEEKGVGGGGKQLPESQSSRRHFGAFFMLTMPGSSRNHPTS